MNRTTLPRHHPQLLNIFFCSYTVICCCFFLNRKWYHSHNTNNCLSTITDFQLCSNTSAVPSAARPTAEESTCPTEQTHLSHTAHSATTSSCISNYYSAFENESWEYDYYIRSERSFLNGNQLSLNIIIFWFTLLIASHLYQTTSAI